MNAKAIIKKNLIIDHPPSTAEEKCRIIVREEVFLFLFLFFGGNLIGEKEVNGAWGWCVARAAVIDLFSAPFLGGVLWFLWSLSLSLSSPAQNMLAHNQPFLFFSLLSFSLI